MVSHTPLKRARLPVPPRPLVTARIILLTASLIVNPEFCFIRKELSHSETAPCKDQLPIICLILPDQFSSFLLAMLIAKSSADADSAIIAIRAVLSEASPVAVTFAAESLEMLISVVLDVPSDSVTVIL